MKPWERRTFVKKLHMKNLAFEREYSRIFN